MLSFVCSFPAKLGTMVACVARASLCAARVRMREAAVGRGFALAAVGAGLIVAAQGLGAQGNLLQNPGFEWPGCNPGFETQYLCWPPVDPGRGYFTVSNNPRAWNGLFNNCPTDHTSGNGRMMILDGDTHLVAWAQTVQNLEANKAYVFRFWALNLYNDNPAVLRVSFRPEPNWQFTQVPPSFHVQIAGCTWQKAEFYWTCNPDFWGPGQPRNMTIVLDNTTSGETGADFALDDMEFTVCLAPVITSQPPSFFVGRSGGSASVAVTFLAPSGLPPGSQPLWSLNGVAVAGGVTTLTETGPNLYTSNLTLSNLSSADAGLYTCTIGTQCGSVTSSASRLRILSVR